jgi:hypothetical protein
VFHVDFYYVVDMLLFFLKKNGTKRHYLFSHKNDSILVSELPPNGTRKHFDSHTKKDSISVSEPPPPTPGNAHFLSTGITSSIII